MSHWLLKSEPTDYSAADLQRDTTTVWTGVSNATALKHLREIKAGDSCFLYHTGKEKAVVALAKITKASPEEGTPTIAFDKLLKHPVPLATIKGDAAFADWQLVRIGRLSVMPVPTVLWKRVISLSAEPPRD